jgi:hypothetical protein
MYNVQILRAIRVDATVYLRVQVPDGSIVEFSADWNALQAAGTPAAKRQILLAAAKAQLRPAVPPPIVASDIGVPFGTIIDVDA